MNAKYIFIILASVGLFIVSCTNINTEATPTTVKSGLSQSVNDVKNAVNTLINSPGYEVLATSNQDLSSVAITNFAPNLVNASSTFFSDSINLNDIAGTYSLQNGKKIKSLAYSFFNQDSRTPSDSMILLLPIAKVNHLNQLFNDTLAAYVKEVKISVSDYQRNVNKTTGESAYRMASNISKTGLKSGTYKITRSVIGPGGSAKIYTTNKEFKFISGHIAKYSSVTSDTAATSTYTLTDGMKTIYQEQFWASKLANDKKIIERKYALTIGHITLVRKPKQSVDSAQIYLNNVLQTKAKITISKTFTFANDSTENGITNGRRSIIITFDDGTTADISTLTGFSTMNRLRDLFAYLRKSYFGSYLIDQAAMNIYKDNKAGRTNK